MGVVEAVRAAEEWAGMVLGEALELLRGCRELGVAWLGLRGRAGGLVLYWFLRQLGGVDVEIVLGEAAAYHLAAYHGSPGCVVAYAEEGAESSLARVFDAYRFTGAEVLAAVAPPLPPPLAARLRGQGVYLLEEPRGNPLAALVFSARLGLGLARIHGASGARVSRLEAELGDLSSVAGEAAEAFKDILGVGEGDYIAYTPTMEPAALLAWRPGVFLLPLSSLIALLSRGVLGGSRVYVLSTGAEDDMVREARFKASISTPPVELRMVRVNTDPLTAPLYASIPLLLGHEGGGGHG